MGTERYCRGIFAAKLLSTGVLTLALTLPLGQMPAAMAQESSLGSAMDMVNSVMQTVQQIAPDASDSDTSATQDSIGSDTSQESNSDNASQQSTSSDNSGGSEAASPSFQQQTPTNNEAWRRHRFQALRERRMQMLHEREWEQAHAQDRQNPSEMAKNNSPNHPNPQRPMRHERMGSASPNMMDQNRPMHLQRGGGLGHFMGRSAMRPGRRMQLASHFGRHFR